MSLANINNRASLNCTKWCPRILRCCVSAEDSSDEEDEKVQKVAEKALKKGSGNDSRHNHTINISVDYHGKE